MVLSEHNSRHRDSQALLQFVLVMYVESATEEIRTNSSSCTPGRRHGRRRRKFTGGRKARFFSPIDSLMLLISLLLRICPVGRVQTREGKRCYLFDPTRLLVSSLLLNGSRRHVCVIPNGSWSPLSC